MIGCGEGPMMTDFVSTTLLDPPTAEAMERPPEAALPSSSGQANEKLETPSDGADLHDVSVPSKFRREVTIATPRILSTKKRRLVSYCPGP